MYTADDILEAVVQSFPFPHHISDIKASGDDGYVYLTWRSTKLRIRISNCEVTGEDNFLWATDNLAIALSKLLCEKIVKVEERKRANKTKSKK